MQINEDQASKKVPKTKTQFSRASSSRSLYCSKIVDPLPRIGQFLEMQEAMRPMPQILSCCHNASDLEQYHPNLPVKCGFLGK